MGTNNAVISLEKYVFFRLLTQLSLNTDFTIYYNSVFFFESYINSLPTILHSCYLDVTDMQN